VPTHEEVGDELQAEIEFDGEHPDSWSVGDGESVKYAAVLRGRERSDELTNTANWELIGWAATIGQDLGKEKDEIVADLEAHPTPQYGFDPNRARREVRREYAKAEAGHATVPSVQRLKEHGLLPDDYVDLDELGTDDRLTGKQKWEAWSDAREAGKVGEDSIVPTAALEYLARENGWYDFSALPDGDDVTLPAKAHNKALWWVKDQWWEPEEHGQHEETEATARNYKSAETTVYTWEDIRYIYDKATQNKGRQAARNLLSKRYDVITPKGTDELLVYNSDTGVYTDNTSRLRVEIYDGLGDKWTRREKNEIIAGLKQSETIHPSEMNGRGVFDDPHICVNNGVLNLFTKEPKPHSPEYYYRERVPVTYDPEADTDPYESFLDEITDREADKKAMLEMVGHALTPDAHERKWKKFLILTGDTDNGKSVFFNRVRDLLDGPDGEEENVASVTLAKMSQSSKDFSKYSMYGNMANIAGEINGKKIRNTADIKDITGGDKMELEPKGKDSFFDTVNTTLMFAANDPPIIGERDKKAIATRIVPVELPYTFVENPTGDYEKAMVPEAELEERLSTEAALSGFLNLALDGIQRLRKNNGDVSLPESRMERLDRYEKSADPMKEFAKECLTNHPNDYIVKADVTTIYEEYATDQGYELGSNTHDNLHEALRGTHALDYSQSYPTNPDYSDTTLSLRGWDDRKYVVDRVTLTDTGREYAQAAGLVVEESDNDVKSILDMGTGMHDGPFRATIAEQIDPPEWLEGKGHLVDDDGGIMPYVVEAGSPLAGIGEGETVLMERVKIEKRNDVPTVALSGVTDVTTDTESPTGPATDDQQNSLQTATDGGTATQQVRRYIKTECSSGETLKTAQVAGDTGIDPESVQSALETIKEEDSLLEAGGDGYVVL
jgi:putative DNA primase/helicase